MSDEPKPLACPFCGTSADDDIVLVPNDDPKRQYVTCDHCGAYGPDGGFVAWNRRVPAPAVPDDVAMPALLASHIEWLRGDHDACNPWLADMIEAQAAELARLRVKAQSRAELLMEAATELEAHHPGSGFAATIRAALTHPTGDTTNGV